ncbi:hypothetical protein [Vulcanisaeta sp. JCM 14467]|uniref:hypothetical protein n=1 Tax=Vulcanisaeta sp. JCM 14467 TaxID=1295370 RepID=UPI0020924D71|nr:hypothetical protein [Vulcanisaeta sp. JCM 14467]
MNWQPLSGDYVMIYSLASLSPKGYIENTLAPTYALMVMKPGRHVMGYVTPAEPTNGTYAICGKYQLVLRNYMGLTVINSYEREIAQFITNATSYTEDNALTIPGGLYQERILVSTGELTIPPGTYVITTTVDITPVSAFVNTTIPQVMSTPLTSSVLPISAGSVITFNLSLSFTGTINQVIIYGAAYTEQPATLSLAILRNGQVMTRASAEAPPITQGMGPHPITFNVNLNVTPGTYQVSIATDQPLIVYITSGTGMSVTSGNMTINYPGNVPTYTITYTVIKAVPIRTTQLTITLTTMNETTSMNITREVRTN